MAEKLSTQELAEAGPPEAVRLPLDLVDPNPHNPRRDLTEIDALADNIRAFGLLQPVTVRRAGERYELLGGHRRHAAFRALREREPHQVVWRTIPAVVRTMDDDDTAYLALLSGGLHSRAWRPREEAAALERLAETRTLRQVGELVHKGESWVSKRLRVYADSVLSGYVQSGKLPASVAEELLVLPDAATRREYAERAIQLEWTAATARAEVRRLKIDKQLREVARRSRELVDILSSIQPGRLPPEATRDLWTLHGRIEVLARGGSVMPTIEAAERAAGVKRQDQPSRRRRSRAKPGKRPVS